jgi:hypothetical protein
MANSINDISDGYERNHFNDQDRMVALIKTYYDYVVQKISPLIAANAVKSVIDRKIDELLKEMVSKTTLAIETGMQTSWEISIKKTNDIFETEYKGMALPPAIQNALDNKRNDALQQFIAEKNNGQTLSDRVWKTADQFKELVDEKIESGLYDGTSAVKIAKDLRSELLNPSTQKNPGQGVYKSPVKNAERLSRTQTNRAYRQSDQASWQNNPMVLGYEIKLSNTSKPKTRCELCRMLTGRYPVTFVWNGWHPQCLCFKVPILMSREQLNQYNKLVATGEDTANNIAAITYKDRVSEPPTALNDWIEQNHERVGGWKQNPYWWNDNKGIVDSILDSIKAA